MKENDLPDYYALQHSETTIYDDIVVGKKVSLSKTFTEKDIQSFLELSGDNNPIHIDEEFAQKTMFKGRVAHGLLSVMLISSGLTKLMGPGNIWLSQDFVFVNPIHINDTVTATLEIVEILRNKTCKIKTICSNQNGKTMLEGTATSRIFPVKKQNK